MGMPRTADQVARREELAAFLKARRDAIRPEDLGIPLRSRRRVKGLRRHEVADAAAMSLTWYTWLEQGRDIRATPQVIDSLARALLLDTDGHRHLRRLAGVPITEPGLRQEQPDEGLRRLVDDLLPHPAHLMEADTSLIAWNRAYAVLFADPDELDPEHRNGLWIQVMCLRDRLGDWESETEFAVARFRAEAAKYPGDVRFGALIAELSEASEFFRAAWQRHHVRRFESHGESVEHPQVGAIRARLIQLRPLDHPHLTLMVHQLADDESRGRLVGLLDGSTKAVASAGS